MSLSKSVFYKTVAGQNCHTLFHPWDENCVCANLDMLYSGIIGTNKFYNLYYPVQLFLKRKRLSKGYLKYLLKGLIQSTIFGVFMANVFVLSNCLQLRMFGRLHYYSCLISATFGGLGVFFENPKRRGVAIVTFINMTLELFVNQLRDSNILTKNRNIEVLLFMVSSAIFMYYLRTDITIKQTGGPHVWFYTPPTFPYTRKESETYTNNNQGAVICPHEGTCWNDIMKAGARYFGIGTCFQILPIIIKHGSKMLKSPYLAGKLIFKRRNAYFGLFLACYVATYEAMSCALCHYQGFDSPLHALPAGFIAGLAYILQPNLSILMAVISNLLMIGGRHFRNSQQLPDWPYGELVLALCNGLLYHSRIFHPQCCPGFLINMIDSCTSGKSALLYSGFKQATTKHLT